MKKCRLKAPVLHQHSAGMGMVCITSRARQCIATHCGWPASAGQVDGRPSTLIARPPIITEARDFGSPVAQVLEVYCCEPSSVEIQFPWSAVHYKKVETKRVSWHFRSAFDTLRLQLHINEAAMPTNMAWLSAYGDPGLPLTLWVSTFFWLGRWLEAYALWGR